MQNRAQINEKVQYLETWLGVHVTDERATGRGPREVTCDTGEVKEVLIGRTPQKERVLRLPVTRVIGELCYREGKPRVIGCKQLAREGKRDLLLAEWEEKIDWYLKRFNLTKADREEVKKDLMRRARAKVEKELEMK